MKRLLLLPLLTAAALAQGPLTPPSVTGPAVGPVAPLDGSGNPQPTMKTLHQVEPRVPVQSLAAAAPYTISQPGSYYLTGNITVATGDAIVINSDDVVLDLNGFTIKSTLVGVSAGTAVFITGAHSRLSVRNGAIVSSTTVVGTANPVRAGFNNGVYAGYITQAVVADLHISGMGNSGIWLDDQGIVERCTVANCGASGIRADEIVDCSVKYCYGAAIYAYSNVANCTGRSTVDYGIYSNGNATNCTGVSTSSYGLFAMENATNCKGSSNGTNTHGLIAMSATNCSGTSASGDGLNVSGNALNCFGTSSSGSGVYADGNVTNCTGVSISGVGLTAIANASNSSGRCTGSASGTGLRVVGNASNCMGTTAGVTATGLWVDGTATSCAGKATGGALSTGLRAAIAIGCTYSGGTTPLVAGKSFNM